MTPRNTSLSSNIVSFARFLRSKNFLITSEDEVSALRAMEKLDLVSEKIFFLALQAVFCKSYKEINGFRDLFIDFWKTQSKSNDSKVVEKPEASRSKRARADSLKSLQSWLNANSGKEEEETASYSISENLARRDFSHVPADDLVELMRLVRLLGKKIARQLNRRLEKSDQASTLDLLRTIRKNIRNENEIIHLIFKRPKRNRVQIVLLCDVSKSMDLYSSFFIQLMYALQNSFKKMETFVFSTKLWRITKLLKQTSFETAMQSLEGETGWGGGTRMGESFSQFVGEYAKLLTKKTVVIILSDGWDNGESQLIDSSMMKLNSLCKKIIWLNPLAGYPNYKPEVKGMKTALPYIKTFAPVHNLVSLRHLGRYI